MRRFLFWMLATMSTFPIEGGVDFVTHAMFAQPGTLSDCCNFERGVEQGATRIDGIVPFDGTEIPSDVSLDFDFVITGTVFEVGDEIQFGGTTAPSGLVESVTFVAVSGIAYRATGTASFPFPYTGETVASLLTLTFNATTPPTQSSAAISLSSGTTVMLGFNSGIFGDGFEPITPVPGRTDSDVHFTHLYRDDVYCARDYEAYTIRGTNSTRLFDPVNGDTIATLTASGRVVKVYGQFGFGAEARVIVNREDSKFAVGDTIYGVMRGSLHKPMCSGGFGSPLSTFQYQGAMTELGVVTALTDETEAGLFKSSDSGWREVDQLSEVKFRLGLLAMQDLVGTIRNSQASVAQDASLIANTGQMLGGNSRNVYKFAGTSAVLLDDTNYTTCVVSNPTFEPGVAGMLVSGFQTGIPTNATIIGVEVEMLRKADVNTASSNVSDLQIALVNVGTAKDVCTLSIQTLSANKATVGEVWTTSDVTKTYGGPTDLWGQAIPASAVLSPDFGVYVAVNRATAGVTFDSNAQIEYIKVKIYYLNALSRVYFYNANAPSTPVDLRNIAADVVQVHTLSGTFTDGDATGVMTVRASSDASAGRSVGAGDVIGALINGATPYATVSSPLVPVTLPSQADLDAADSQYRAINANFYASEDYEAAYIVNGAGPAFAIERNGVIRIHPDLTSDLNKPRHVAKHADLLGLAYPNGSVLFSVEGSPYNMNGLEGAFEWPFGDRVTGIFPMAKDSLGVLCQSSVIALSGRTESTMQPNTISAKTGGIEYAAVDMGFLVFVDSFGITTIDTTDRYGDFLAGRLSFKAWPWLRPRVQALSSDSTLRVQTAYAVRNKNQLRVVFKDGWAASVSFVGAERDPHIYLHRWHYDNATVDAVFVPRHVSSGVDSRGVERIFATMAYDAQWNLEGQQFVYEVDKLWFMTFWSGSAFVANPIQSYLVTNWNDERDPDALKRFESFGVYGRSQFPVTFQAGRAVNYGLTTNSAGVAATLVDLTFGTSGEIVPPIAYNRKTTAHLAVEGEDIAIRFESDAADTPPFTISAISLPYDSRGKTRGQRT